MESKRYWNNRYNTGLTSGYGSYGEQLVKKLQWLSNLDVKSISEIGCGDFNFGKHLLEIYPDAKYTGQDISNVIVDRNNRDYPHAFTTDINELPSADLLLCVDVLFHLLEDSEVEVLLKFIDSKWTKYLAITAYERNEALDTHVRIRKFDYKRFGEPVIREVVEDNGQLYFYLYDRSK